MDPFRNLVGIGGAGCSEVDIDHSRVQLEEFTTAQTFANIIWGPDGLIENLGPTWSMVHDPRFLAIERLWAREDAGRLGGVTRRGVSIVDALDLQSKIRIIEDPELYSEMLAEGRHFRDAVIALGLSPQSFHHDEAVIDALMRQECPNYIRRNGSWNPEAESLMAMLKAGLVALVDDYAQLAYSRDWVRMDTGEVVEKGEVIWDPMSGDQIPIVAVEVDTLHKALIMRAQVRTTALRMMQTFPGIDKAEFGELILTDHESDALCQILFSADYEKMYTVVPAVMALVMRAKAVPFEVREHAALAELSHAAADFTAKLRSGEIEPIITPIEEDPNAVMDPSAFLGQLQSNPYLSEVFLTVQNLGERLDEVAAALCTELFASGGSTETWAKVENYLLAEGKHPKQGVFEGRDILSPTAKEWLRRELQEVEADDYNSNDPRHLTGAEVEKALSAREYSFCHEAAFLAQAVVMRGVAAPDMELADLASSLQRKATASRPEVRSYGEDRPPGASSRSRTWRCRCGRWRRPEGPGLAVRHPGDQRPGQCPPTTLSAFRPCSGPWKSSRSSPRWRKPGTMPSPQESSSGFAPV